MKPIRRAKIRRPEPGATDPCSSMAPHFHPPLSSTNARSTPLTFLPPCRCRQLILRIGNSPLCNPSGRSDGSSTGCSDPGWARPAGVAKQEGDAHAFLRAYEGQLVSPAGRTQSPLPSLRGTSPHAPARWELLQILLNRSGLAIKFRASDTDKGAKGMSTKRHMPVAWHQTMGGCERTRLVGYLSPAGSSSAQV